ncbi:dual specificity protein kinase yak1, partial [Ceratobasidium sp. 370]
MFAVVIKKASPERPLGHIPDNSTRGNRLWPLLKRCWAYEPDDRPSAKEVRDIMQGMVQKRVAQAGYSGTSKDLANSFFKVDGSSQSPPSGRPDNIVPGDRETPTEARPPSPPNQHSTPGSTRHGFRPVRDPKDFQPRIDSALVGARPAGRIYLSPVRLLTTHIIQTYSLCNPEFHYELARNPRRLLTQPSKPVYNDGYDNEVHDYILYVNERLGPDNQYLILDLLGQGKSSWVVECQDVKSHEIVAIKVVKNKPAYFNQSMMEVTILELLNTQFDPNDEHHIVRLRDTFVHKNHICLVFELLSSSLRELSKQALPNGLSPKLAGILTNQLLDAMTVLNEACLIHGDLSPENILLINLKSPRIKLIDFGSACHERQIVDTDVQSLTYRAPEVLLGMEYNSAIDMWSLGCITVGFVLGRPLFSGTTAYDQITQIVETLG